jgi:hypothetical protein
LNADADVEAVYARMDTSTALNPFAMTIGLPVWRIHGMWITVSQYNSRRTMPRAHSRVSACWITHLAGSEDRHTVMRRPEIAS